MERVYGCGQVFFFLLESNRGENAVSPYNSSSNPVDYGHSDHNTHDSSLSSISSTDAETDSSSDSEISSEGNPKLKEELAEIVADHLPSRAFVNSLLSVLQKHHPELPKDCRTLLGTIRTVDVQKRLGGDFCYFGIQNSLKSSKVLNPDHVQLKMMVNIDGLPLSKSSSSAFWPILMSVNGCSPLIVALFYGDKKPNDIHEYLSDFITEYKELESHGFQHEGVRYFVSLSCVVADAPARSFIKQVVPHYHSYHSCERCNVVGTFRGRVIYDEVNVSFVPMMSLIVISTMVLIRKASHLFQVL